MAIRQRFVNDFGSKIGANFEDNLPSTAPQEYMHCFDVNDEINVVQDEAMDPEGRR